MIEETKILKFKIEVFRHVLVPVFIGHGESIYVETETSWSKKTYNKDKNIGLPLVDKRIDGGYVTRRTAGEDDVFISQKKKIDLIKNR